MSHSIYKDLLAHFIINGFFIDFCRKAILSFNSIDPITTDMEILNIIRNAISCDFDCTTVNTVQQKNGTDCGLFLLTYVKTFLKVIYKLYFLNIKYMLNC